jgi:hypothetical protein
MAMTRLLFALTDSQLAKFGAGLILFDLLLLPILGAFIPRKHRWRLFLVVAIVGIPWGFLVDNKDGGSGGFIGVPLVLMFLVLIGVVCRFVFDWLFVGHRVMAEGLCPKCGYDLRATPLKCPECGTEAKPSRR